MGWVLESGKFAFYIAFPVGLFYYFNHPKVYEYFVAENYKRAQKEEKGLTEFLEFKAEYNETVRQKEREAYEQMRKNLGAKK